MMITTTEFYTIVKFQGHSNGNMKLKISSLLGKLSSKMEIRVFLIFTIRSKYIQV